ncbi:MAG TPA: transcription antitermination factor NusB [Chitinispirillaceae bacterium]|nr:transcription antitermination factor NusB [Chitinispirillaceae bacterium]
MNKKKVNKSGEFGYRYRHKARELALQTLYACEIGTDNNWRFVLEQIAETASMSDEVKKYARVLVSAVFDSIDQIDLTIRERAANWELKRMAAIDRNIIRLAVAEFESVPAKVVIDEAVELAKTFGTEDSGKFVNGILDSIHKKMKGHSPMSGKEGSEHGTNPRQA